MSSQLASKASEVVKLKEEINAAEKYRSEVKDREKKRLASLVPVGVMTDPAMELLENHKAALEAKLCQVKEDVS